jgi:hypothetical protein
MSLPDTKRLIFRKFTNEHTKTMICMAIRSESDINSELKYRLKDAYDKA